MDSHTQLTSPLPPLKVTIRVHPAVLPRSSFCASRIPYPESRILNLETRIPPCHRGNLHACCAPFSANPLSQPCPELLTKSRLMIPRAAPRRSFRHRRKEWMKLPRIPPPA